jgi:two-component system, LytTR family, response regulator
MENNEKEFLVLTVGRNRKRKVYFEEIMYCRADNTYTTFHITGSRSITVSRSIGEIADALGTLRFLRISRSVIVNVDRCVEIKTGLRPEIILSNNDKLFPERKHLVELERRMFGF